MYNYFCIFEHTSLTSSDNCFTHTYIHRHVHTHLHTCMYIHIHIYTHARTNTHSYHFRIRFPEVECSRPPDVVNTTWYEDKKSLRTRRVIYQCLPRYRLVSGQLWKVCGPRGNWTGQDPVCEGRHGETETAEIYLN